MTVCLLFFSLLLLFTGCSIHKPSTAADRYGESPGSQIIHFYQGPLNHLSAVRYGGCPMHPNCSEYGLSAIEKHGALIGWMMMFDRLTRCGLDETHLSPEVIVDGRWKYIDTLEQNDFWWCSANKNTFLIKTQPSEQSLQWGISIE
ncbi:MAG: membrane protein insertion efficiency factor YidD [Desulfobacteraceae bacterium]|nr:membrane protein insertion efficiency factor YidD [Desulfobacteraceae bacterium]MBC2754590.1 membrane protein insertion efficiency factor YidD [Desulfobacteraceae bacterium]